MGYINREPDKTSIQICQLDVHFTPEKNTEELQYEDAELIELRCKVEALWK